MRGTPIEIGKTELMEMTGDAERKAHLTVCTRGVKRPRGKEKKREKKKKKNGGRAGTKH